MVIYARLKKEIVEIQLLIYMYILPPFIKRQIDENIDNLDKRLQFPKF